jgi:hypothetical protein
MTPASKGRSLFRMGRFVWPLVLAIVACGGGSGSPDGGGTDAGPPPDGGSDAVAPDGGGGDGGGGVWRPFSDTSPWNTPIDANPTIDPNSDALVTDLSTISGQTTVWINIPQYSIPVYYVDSTTTTMVTVSASVGGTGFRTGAANDGVAAGQGQAPIPAGATPAAGTDKHLDVVDKTQRMEWGLWNANFASPDWTAGEASTMDLSGDGVRPPTTQAPWWAGQGARACGFPLIAGLITVDEIKAGDIEHALVVAYPHIRSRYFTPPASSAQGTTTEALPTRGILCGGHIQLDPTLDPTTLGLSPAGLAVARALQKYGAFVGDFSGSVSLYADASGTAQAYWNGGALSSSDAQKIPLDKFRVLLIGTTYDNNN